MDSGPRFPIAASPAAGEAVSEAVAEQPVEAFDIVGADVVGWAFAGFVGGFLPLDSLCL